MKLSPLFACFIACALAAVPAFAQKATHSGPNPVQKFAFYHNSDPGLSHLNFFEKNASAMQVTPTDMVLEAKSTDEQGFTHYKYQQYYQGIPIFGCHYMLHEKDGVVRSANGQFQPNSGVSASASISAETSKSFAIQDLKSKKYDREKTKATLCFFNTSSTPSPQSLRLAYMVDFHSIQPFEKRRYFIDANTGKILKQYPLLLQEGVPSKAKTFYYGTQDIISDSLGPQNFVLRDPSRGEGIFVYNSNNNELYYNNSSFWQLGTANMADVALDAHYCSEKYYDMMLSDYNWNGVNGQGGALIANVHDGAYVNAFWDGESTTYGDGDCNYGPLTTLEVMGHEFTHGMVQFTSALVYDSESGAMNESLADIFGKLLERKVDPNNFSWDLGHSFIINPNSEPLRVMDDPLSLGMPAYYKGQFWDDNNDVHYNSSIGNLWFSMIMDGKQGTNEAGYTFDVSPLGPVKAGQIIFNTNKNYLTENATYNDFCNYSIEVAGSLYGLGSPEQLAVTEAWKAVGLPFNNQSDFYDLQIYSDAQFTTGHICSLNQFSPISVTITNSGTKAYDPATEGTFTLSCFGLPDRIVTLTDPIAPGESVDYLIDDWIKPTDYGYLSVVANLDVLDDNPNNNAIFVSYFVVQYASDELSLSAYLVEPGCFEPTQTGFFYVANNSCETVPAGTEVKIVIKDDLGATLWSGPTEALPTDIVSGYSSSFVYDIPVFNQAVVYTLVYAPDPDLSNNQYYSDPTSTVQPITGNYLNNFEVNDGLDGYLKLNYFASAPTLALQNNHMFASTGYNSDPESFAHCADPFQVFSSPFNSGINASLSACIDFSTVATSTVEFDAAQFRNSFSNSNNYLYSSMLQANWVGNESGNQIIYDQQEGQIKHTKIDLPPYFKGELSFYLYTEVGQWELNTNNLSTDDFILFDNLKLRTSTSGDHEAPDNKSILIAPNPATETTRIQTGLPMKSIRVFNAAGQLLQSLSVNGYSQDLDLRKFSNGLYWIGIQFENGTESVQKLVKMD